MTAVINFHVDPELKDLAGEAAKKAGIPLGEFIARAIAEKLGRPDLGNIPRISWGRPRKPARAQPA